jgi:hypothetical protein
VLDHPVDPLARDETSYAHGEAPRSELAAPRFDRAGDVRHLDRRRLHPRDPLDGRARLGVEQREKIEPRRRGGERPRRGPCGRRADDRARDRGRCCREQPDVRPMGDHVEAGSRECQRGDRPCARNAPVRDDAIRRRPAQARASGRDPSSRVERAQRAFPQPRRDPRPPERLSRRGCNDDDLVSVAFELPDVSSDEVPRRIAFVLRPAGGYDCDAHPIARRSPSM